MNSLSGRAKVADRAATRRSHIVARSNPPASAGPWTEAISGSGKLRSRSCQRSLDAHSASWTDSSSNSRRSNPAEKTAPVEAITTTRTDSSPARASSASLISSRTRIDRALRFAGRSSVSQATASSGRETDTKSGIAGC